MRKQLHASAMAPSARSEELVTSTVGDEAIVYDRRNAQIHRLDSRCTAVWNALDGYRTVPEITAAARMLNDDLTLLALS